MTKKLNLFVFSFVLASIMPACQWSKNKSTQETRATKATASSDLILSITNNTEFQAQVIKKSKPAVVKFYAPWCGPCKQLGPIFEKVAQELKDMCTFVKINVDHAQNLATQYGVTGVPTIIFFKDGKEVYKKTGFVKEEILKAEILNKLK